MKLKLFLKYSGAVSMCFTFYCIWSLTAVSMKQERLNENFEELQRMVHVMHGASMMDRFAKENIINKTIVHEPHIKTLYTTMKPNIHDVKDIKMKEFDQAVVSSSHSYL